MMSASKLTLTRHDVCKVLGSVQSTAQVHPEKLTKAMMAAAESRGAEVRMGTVESVTTTAGPASQVTGGIRCHTQLAPCWVLTPRLCLCL